MILEDYAGNEWLCDFDHKWLDLGDLRVTLQVCRMNEPLHQWMNRKHAIEAGLPVIEWEAQMENDDDWIKEQIECEFGHDVDLRIDQFKEERRGI